MTYKMHMLIIWNYCLFLLLRPLRTFHRVWGEKLSGVDFMECGEISVIRWIISKQNAFFLCKIYSLYHTWCKADLPKNRLSLRISNEFKGQRRNNLCVWVIGETALVIHPRRDVDRFNYCIWIAHQPLLASDKTWNPHCTRLPKCFSCLYKVAWSQIRH